ncbi:unnamed protein product, partial [Polarella glacialis]
METLDQSMQVAIRRHPETMKQLKQVFAGGIAGCVAKTSVAPLSRVTVLMQVQSMRPHKFADGLNPNNLYLRDSLRKIHREEGFRAFWKGNVATMVHRFPYTAVTFYANALFRRQLLQQPSTARLPEQMRHLIAGGGGACLAVLLVHPLDVVKTRLMVQTRKQYYSGLLDALQKIYRDEGRPGLYRGLGVSLCSAVPTIAVNFALFDEFSRIYGDLGLQPRPRGHF